MPSVFTSLVTSVLDVPGDPGHTVTIRKLAPKHLIAAQKAKSSQAMSELKDMLGRFDLGGAVKVEQLQALIATASPAALASTTPVPAVPVASVDPLSGFDCLVLMQYGTIAWSYLTPEISRESLEDLDDETVEWLSTHILKLAKPSLFEADTEAAAKNG